MRRKEFFIAIPFFMISLSVQALVYHPQVTEYVQKSQINLAHKEEQTAEANIEKVGAVNIIKVEIPYSNDVDGLIQKALKEASLEDKKVTLKALQTSPNALILLYGERDITSIKAHSVDAGSLGKCDWDFDTYHKTYGMDNYELLKNKIEASEVLAITCIEPEGLPLNYLTWDTMSVKQNKWIIQYNGK